MALPLVDTKQPLLSSLSLSSISCFVVFSPSPFWYHTTGFFWSNVLLLAASNYFSSTHRGHPVSCIQTHPSATVWWDKALTLAPWLSVRVSLVLSPRCSNQSSVQPHLRHPHPHAQSPPWADKPYLL